MMTAADHGPSMDASERSQRGVTMFEVLIALLIIALFVLTSARGQSSAAKLSKAAQFRTEAVLLATEMSERIEANGEAAANGSYACDPCSTTTTPPAACVNAACSSSALAAFDQQEWGKRAGAVLPDAALSIVWACTSGCVPTDPPSRVLGTYTITIGWNDRRANVTYDPSLAGTTEAFRYTMNKIVFFDPG